MPKLRGQVKEKWSGKPVSSAVVTVDDAQVLTDGNGVFSMNINSTNVTLRIMHIGYETLTVQLALFPISEGNVEITLTPSGVRSL